MTGDKKGFETRMDELVSIAEEEGISLSSASEAELRSFVAAFGYPDCVFLLDDGTYRGRWLVEGQGTSIAFGEHGAIRAIHIPLKSRSS